MPDELDTIQERIDRELEMRIGAERSKKVESPKGVCLYCFTVCADDASFCDEECSEAYREEQDIKQFQQTGKRG